MGDSFDDPKSLQKVDVTFGDAIPAGCQFLEDSCTRWMSSGARFVQNWTIFLSFHQIVSNLQIVSFLQE